MFGDPALNALIIVFFFVVVVLFLAEGRNGDGSD
jgi:hypothetical protein